MLVRVRLALLSALVLLELVGCGPSLVSMSAGQIGCRPSDVSISEVRNSFDSRNWVAVCHGAEFSCSHVTTGGGSSSTSQVNCSPIGGRSSARTARPAPAPTDSAIPSYGAGSAEIKRGYDEGRRAHFVTGRFGLAQRLELIVTGAPKVAMGTISVTLSGKSSEGTVRLCPGLEALINGEPMATERNEASVAAGDGGGPLLGPVKIESRFEFSVFQPLAGRFPVFGVRACGTSWAFTPHQVEQLRALLVVYSDLAKAVQGDPDADAQPAPGQTAL